MADGSKVVVDASIWLGYLLTDEEIDNNCVDWLEMADKGKARIICPNLLPYEFLNGLYACVLKKRIDTNLALKIYDQFLKITIYYKDIDFRYTFKLAAKHKLSVYDASYLWLAVNNKCKLLSLDKKLLLAYKLELEEINC